MNLSPRRSIVRSVLCVLVMLAVTPAFGFKYGEHKMIGDTAFARFVAQPGVKRFFQDTLDMCRARWAGYTDVFSRVVDSLTYGDLTGLSADHGTDPLEIFDNLLSHKTKLARTLVAHTHAIEAGSLTGAGDGALTAIDIEYPLMGAADKSHFYRLGMSFHEMLTAVTLGGIDSLNNDFYTALVDVFERLLETNSMSKYATLHAIALQMMFYAGRDMRAGTVPSRRNGAERIEKALLFNAFADHFLQDAFAAGHLAVKRSASRPLDNMGTHGFYNRIGLDVTNMRGDRSWRTYGDGFLPVPSEEFSHAVDANFQSLSELWAEYQRGVAGAGTSVVDSLQQQSDRAAFMLSRFGVFRIMPIPMEESRITFANSRNGMCYAVQGGVSGSTPTVGVRIALGYNLTNAPQHDSTSESRLCIFPVNVGVARALTDSAAWTDAWFTAETIMSDWLMTGIDLGARMRSGKSNGLLRPSIGYEFKPVTWSIAPSLRVSWCMVSHAAPAVGVTLELRYY